MFKLLKKQNTNISNLLCNERTLLCSVNVIYNIKEKRLVEIKSNKDNEKKMNVNVSLNSTGKMRC